MGKLTNFVKKVGEVASREYADWRDDVADSIQDDQSDLFDMAGEAYNNMVEQKRMEEYQQAVEQADGFDDLMDAVDEYGGVIGSKKVYTPAELREQIEVVHEIVDPGSHTKVPSRDYASEEVEKLDDEENIMYITNENGLRDRVKELVEDEGYTVDNRGYIH